MKSFLGNGKGRRPDPIVGVKRQIKFLSKHTEVNLEKLAIRYSSRMWPRVKQAIRLCLGRKQTQVLLKVKKIIYDSWSQSQYYLSKDSSLEDFFSLVSDLHYAVLRWPTNPRGGDLDILVSDENVQDFFFFLKKQRKWQSKGKIRVEIKPISGTPGVLPHFHFAFGEKILNSAVTGPFGAKVPSGQILYLALVYHAVIHRGAKSGIPVSGSSHTFTTRTSNHNYLELIIYINQLMNKNINVNLENLFAELERSGSLPPLDYMLKWAESNSWLFDRLKKKILHQSSNTRKIVFFIREKFAETDTIEELTRMLSLRDFRVELSRRLTLDEVDRVMNEVRGSVWYQGAPYYLSKPGYIIVCSDKKSPSTLEELFIRHPWKDNPRALRVKSEMRKFIIKKYSIAVEEHTLHSSDNNSLANHYLSILNSDITHGKHD